jgi:hypothetical protein
MKLQFHVSEAYFGVVKIVLVSLFLFTYKGCSYQRNSSSNSWKGTIISTNQCRPYLSKTTYVPKNIFVHMFSKKLKDVTGKTNI